MPPVLCIFCGVIERYWFSKTRVMSQSAPCKAFSDLPNWSSHFALDHLQAFDILKNHVGVFTADGCCSFRLCWASDSALSVAGDSDFSRGCQ